jgi:phosphoenolpyruvate phosphomutase
MINKAKRLRQIFAGEKLIRVLGAHNPLSAKLAERAKFDAVWASGFEISASYGVPDANILTMTDFLNVASSMNEAISIPVIADCDTGFGNSNNVIHMVKKYEAAGIAAICIEDKHFPKVNSFIAGRQELTPVSEFVGKILAAKNAQTDKNFMVIARVEALIADWGVQEALKRAEAYVDAGADAILIHSKSRTIDEIAEFARAWENRAALVVVPTTYYNININDLEKLKIKMVIYANHGIRASVRAMQEAFVKIYEGGSTSCIEDRIAGMQEIFDLQGMYKMKNDEMLYACPENQRIAALIPVAGDHLEEYSMKEISRDIPIAMLDINGKPLLQRQIETLYKCGIYDVRVVAGYKKEKINVDGIKLIDNKRYKTSGILYSVMQGLKEIDNPCLVIYGDVLFDHFLINKALNKNSEIVLTVDSTYDAKRQNNKKRPELVVTDVEIKNNQRMLHRDALHRVRKIGNCVKDNETNLEFCGIMFLSQGGVRTIKENYAKCAKWGKKRKAQQRDNFYKMTLVDFLQRLIESGCAVNCFDVNSGWLEVHSMQDYKFACSVFK